MHTEWEPGTTAIGKHAEWGISVVWEESLCNAIELSQTVLITVAWCQVPRFSSPLSVR